MTYLILGVAVLAGFLLAGHWFVSAEPKAVIRLIKWALVAIILFVMLFFVLSGRLAWAFATLPALFPWFLRARAAAGMARNFARMKRAMDGAKDESAGSASEATARFLIVRFDYQSGRMSGEVLEGHFAGRRLETLAPDALLELLETCQSEDAESALLLESYLDGMHRGWRDAARHTGHQQAAGPSGPMTRDEAWKILGLEPGADEAAIKEAYKRLMAGLHPDLGGSDYLAAKINQARDILIKPT